MENNMSPLESCCTLCHRHDYDDVYVVDDNEEDQEDNDDEEDQDGEDDKDEELWI